MFVILFGKISIKQTKEKSSLEESSFYKNYYSKEDLLLINVWSIGSQSILEGNPKIEEIVNNNEVSLITISTEEDTLKLKGYLLNKPIVKTKDITLQNYTARDRIFEVIEFSDYKKGLSNIVTFSVKKTPYTVLIKNKEIIFKSDDNLDIKKLDEILKSIKNKHF